MAYCPKCGTPVAVQSYQRVRHEDRTFESLAIAGVAVVVAVAVLVVALVVVGLIPTIGIGSHVGSGHLSTQQVALSEFNGVDAGYGFNVVITQGSNYSVSITTDDNLQQYVDVYKTGSTLYVRLKPNIGGVQTTTLRAEIIMPDLESVQFSGGVVANAQSFNMSHDFNVDLSGGSSFTMTGQAADLTAVCSGGANLHFADFKVHNASVDLSGGSQGTINLDSRLDANLSGGAHLFYTGNATLGTINTSGGAGISPVS